MIQRDTHCKKGVYTVLFLGTQGQGGRVTEVTFALGHKGFVGCSESSRLVKETPGRDRRSQAPEMTRHKPGKGRAPSSLVGGGLGLV